MTYQVTAGYVTVTTAVPGGRARVDIQRGNALPDDVPSEEVDALLRLGSLVWVADDPGPASDDVGVDEPPALAVPNGTVAEMLAWVGSDPVRAAAALAAEQDLDNPRSTLVAKLGELLADAE